MKKFLAISFATLGVALFVLAASRAQAADLKLNGDFRVRAFHLDDVNDRNEDADDREAFADQRFRLKTELSSGDVAGIIVVDFTNGSKGHDEAVFQNPATAPAAAGDGNSGNTRLGTVGFGRSFNVIGIREAYLRVKFPAFGFAAGRKPFKLGHGLVLDDTADAIAVRLGPQLLNLTLADIKLLDTDAVGVGGTGSDADLYVAKINFMHEDQHNVGVFVTYLNDRGPGLTVLGAAAPAGSDKTTLTTVGVTADGKFGPVKLDVEFDWLDGKRDATVGTGNDLEGQNLLVGAGFGEMLPFGVNATLVWASGQDTSTKQNVNGLSPNFVLGNILVNHKHNSDRDGGNVACPMPGLTPLCPGLQALKVSGMVGGVPMMHNSSLEAALIWAQTDEDVCPVAPVTGSCESDLGWEFDVNARSALSENASIFATFGYLVAGDAFKAAGGSTADDNPIKGLIGLSYNF